MDNTAKKTACRSELAEKTGFDIPVAFAEKGEAGKTAGQGGVGTGAESSWLGKRIAAYARVSTLAQEKEETVQSQLDAIRVFARGRGVGISGDDEFLDEGYSGSGIIRPGLDRLRDGVASGDYEIVLVYDPDRLARNYVYQMIVLEEFEKHGCELVFVRRPIGQSPDERLLLQMQGVISEYERAKIHERTRRGRLHKMKCGVLVTGRKTFGYRYVPRHGDIPARYERVEGEAGYVRDIFKWYTGERISMRQIAARLNSAGVSTVRGLRWRSSSIHYMLRNTMYTGTGHGHKVECVLPAEKPLETIYRKYAKTGKKARPKDEWLPFSCPAIIDDEMFELAQQRLEHNRNMSSRRTVGEYLLRGIVSCPHCGKNMKSEGRSMKYICKNTRKSSAADMGMDVCGNNSRFPVDKLDELVWKEVVKILKKPANLRDSFRSLGGEIHPQASGSIGTLEEKKKKAEESMRRINALFIRGILSEEEHARQHGVFKDKLHQTLLHLDKLKDDRMEKEEVELMLGNFNRFSNSVKSQIGNADFSERRSIVEQMVKKVFIGKKDVTIEFATPLLKCSLRPVNHRRLTAI